MVKQTVITYLCHSLDNKICSTMEQRHRINKVTVRSLQIEDYSQLSQSFRRTYTDGSDEFWSREQIQKLIDIFPEGQIVTEVDKKIVGCALSMIVDYDKVKNDHTYDSLTGHETFDTHNPKGNILYGIEVFIHPDYRGLRPGPENVRISEGNSAKR